MMLDFPEELLEDFDIIEEEEVKEEVHGDNEQPALHKYGPLKVNKWYQVIEEGFDWVVVRLRGQRLVVPKWVFVK